MNQDNETHTRYHPSAEQLALSMTMGDSLEELLPLSRLHVSHQEEAPTWASLEDIDWGERGARRGLGAVEEALIVMRLGRRLASPAVVATIGAAQISREGAGWLGKRVAAAYRRADRIIMVEEPGTAMVLVRAADGYERQVYPRTGTTGSRRGRPVKPLTDPTLIARRATFNRASDKRRGLPVFMPMRYADDFVILVSSPDRDPDQCRMLAEQEKSDLAAMLETQMGLTLSPEKTLVTPVTSTMRFLGHHLRVRRHPRHRRLVPRLVIPKDRSQRLRRSIGLIFDRSTVTETLENRLKCLNPLLRGWGNFYRHAWGAKRVFAGIDNHVWWTIQRWLVKKHPDTPMNQIAKQYGWHKPRQRALRWRDGDTVPVPLAAIRVVRYHQGADPGPHYA